MANEKRNGQYFPILVACQAKDQRLGGGLVNDCPAED